MCAPCSSAAHPGLSASSIHTLETIDIVMGMFVPGHISQWPYMHRLASTDRGMAVKDNLKCSVWIYYQVTT